MKTNPFTNPTVAAEVTRRTHEPIHPPPPHVGGYARTLRRSTLHALTLLCAATLFTHATFAAKPGPNPPPPPSNGTLVLEYLGGTGGSSGLTVVPSGTIYASGSVSGVPTDRGVVLSSSDSGATWIGPLDDFASSGGYTYYNGIVSDAAGNLYVAGMSPSSTGSQHWTVRKNPGGTGSWSTYDDYQYAGGSTIPSSMAADASGNLFVGGAGIDHWLIKKY